MREPVSPFDPSRLRRLLIVKLSSLGDVTHALPVATALRRRYPHLRLTWAVERWTAPLVLGHPAIDHVVTFPRMRWGDAGSAWLRSFAAAVRELRREPYDVSLDLQGLAKSALVARCSGAPMRLAMHSQREGARFVSQSVPPPRGPLHVVDDYLRCAEFLGAPAAPAIFDLPVQAAAVTAVAALLSAARIPPGAPLIVINPSTSASWRNWPPRHWTQVIEALGTNGTVALIGSREQMPSHAALARDIAHPPCDLTGRTSLAELVALLARCALHIAGDTGSAHIAAALGRPVVGIYGPTAPWRKAPYGWDDLAVHQAGACGRACPRWCLRGRRCLAAVSADDVIRQARRALAGEGRRSPRT